MPAMRPGDITSTFDAEDTAATTFADGDGDGDERSTRTVMRDAMYDGDVVALLTTASEPSDKNTGAVAHPLPKAVENFASARVPSAE